MRRAAMCTVMAVIASLVSMVPSAAAAEPRSRVSPFLVSCGAALPKLGGGTWQCTFADEFNGTSLDRTKWMPQTNFATGAPSASARSCHVDDPRNVAVRNGTLELTIRKSKVPVSCLGTLADYTSGQVSTYRKFSQQYGRFEARIKTTATTQPGLQESFWLWPDDRILTHLIWPAAGEIDIAETYSQHPTLAIPFLHYTWFDNWGPIPGLNTAWNCSAARGVFNTFTLMWTSTTLTIQVNGKTCLVNRSGNVAFKKPYIVALSAALGVGANARTPSTPLPATMTVDYLRVWR